MIEPAPDMRLAGAIAQRVSGCAHRDLVRLAKFIGVEKAHMKKRLILEIAVKREVFGHQDTEWL